MAVCNPASIIAQGSIYSGLSPLQIRMVQLALLRAWLLSLDPGADVTPGGIMARASYLGGLSPGQIRMLTLQMLCNLSA